MAVRPLNYISLCAGGGGLDLGFELAVPGSRPVVYMERESFACATLVAAMEANLLAPAPLWSDVRTFDGRPWRGLVDGVIGGIPCQPHSQAGRRLGKDDERDLWSAARRIIVQSGAWFVLIENVSGMLTTGGAARVRGDLQRLGYEVEGGLYTAAEVGAPHERKRLFILAVADSRYGQFPAARRGSERRAGSRPAGPEGMADATGVGSEQGPGWGQGSAGQVGDGRLSEPSTRGSPVADSEREGLEGHRGDGNDRGEPGWHDTGAVGPVGARRVPMGLFPPGPGDYDEWNEVLGRAPGFEPAVRRVADGMALRLDRLRMLGNGVVPLQAAYAVRHLANALASRSRAAATLLAVDTEDE